MVSLFFDGPSRTCVVTYSSFFRFLCSFKRTVTSPQPCPQVVGGNVGGFKSVHPTVASPSWHLFTRGSHRVCTSRNFSRAPFKVGASPRASRTRLCWVKEKIVLVRGTKHQLDPTDYGSTMSEPMAESALPKFPGDMLVLESSDVTANDLQVILEQQGYTLTDRCLEEGTGTGCCVFVFKGEPDANYEDSPGLDAVEAEVDADSDSDSDSEVAQVFKGEGERKLGWRKKTIGNPTGNNDPIISVPGTEDQKLSVEVVLSYAVDKDHPDDPDMVGLCLKMKQICFGVLNNIDEPDQRGHFVYRIEVTALPIGWSTKVDHVIANPSSDDCVTISKQKTDTKSVGLNVGETTAPLNLQYSKAYGTTTSGISAHGWSSTGMDISARSVVWTWGIKYWCNGQQFCPDDLGKLLGSLPTFQHIPHLPFDDLQSVNLNKTNTEAEWVVPKSQLQGVKEIQWDISVKFQTALVMKKRWIAIGNRSFGVSSVRVCKELPPLVHRFKVKVDL